MQNINFGDPSLLYGPGLGGLWAGRQQANNFQDEANQQAKTLEDIATAQQKRQFEAEQQPLTLEKMRGENALYPGKLTELNQKNEAERAKLDHQNYSTYADEVFSWRQAHPQASPMELAAFTADAAKRNKLDPADQRVGMVGHVAQGGPKAMDTFSKALFLRSEKGQEGAQREEAALERQKLANKGHLEATNASVQGQKDVEQMRIDAGKYNRNTLKVTLETELLKAKSATERVQKLVDAANVAAQAGDTETAQQYLARAKALEPQAQAEINKMKPPGINTPAVTGMPANPTTPIVPSAPAVSGPAASPNQVPKPPVPPVNAQGWRLHVDKNGNRAYVGPNGEIEEVK